MRMLIVAAVAACATPEEGAHEARLARGRDLAAAQCAVCHAIARTGDSPRRDAPPFRRLSRNYRVADLEEALAEGISVGHPAMPQFAFAPEDVDALIGYLQSIQEAPREGE